MKSDNVDNIVEFKNVSMQFPGVLANDNVSFGIKSGEIFALVGENGAGKSTLMNVLYGINNPTSGEVYIKGKKVESFSPTEAIENGIGMVHQHFMLVPSFTVAENIVLSKEPRKAGFIYNKAKAIEITENLVKEFGLKVNPKDIVSETSVGIQQRVEILKTLYRGADVLILDEPTAVLTPSETKELFAVIRRVVKELGMTVIIITHKLYEVMAISDRVGVMRQGKLVGVNETKAVDEKKLASMMVGREVLLEKLEKTGTLGKLKIKTDNLYVADNRGLPAVNGVSFEIREGEILGIAAIEGNGQSELVEAITGLRHIEAGHVYIEDKNVTDYTARQIRAAGVAHIPEDRVSTGVSGPSSILENLIIGKERRGQFSIRGIHLRQSSIRRYADDMFKKFDIRGAGVDTRVDSLSGGNMQKVVVAREFSYDTPILIIAQPTRGVDIGAMEFIHDKIVEKRNNGAAILLISADLDEVFRLSDRIITLYEGKITGEFKSGEISKMDIGYYMTGDRRDDND